MRIILDVNSLIYLIKTNLFIRFIELTSNPIVIDTSVYGEVVEDGIAQNYPDAYIAKKFLKDFKIEIIPVDISKELPLFRDPGETSCYILAQDYGVCLTSDRKAINKMISFDHEPISLDEYFYNLCLNNSLPFEELEIILKKFVGVYASTEERKRIFLEKIEKIKNMEKIKMNKGEDIHE